MSLDSVVTNFTDKDFLAELKKLSKEEQIDVQQTALGEMITDPGFQSAIKEDEEAAIGSIRTFANQHFPIPITMDRPSQQALIHPGEDQGILENLVDPGVLLDPFNVATGVGAGATMGLKKGVVQGVKQGIEGGAQAALGAAALAGPLKRGVGAMTTELLKKEAPVATKPIPEIKAAPSPAPFKNEAGEVEMQAVHEPTPAPQPTELTPTVEGGPPTVPPKVPPPGADAGGPIPDPKPLFDINLASKTTGEIAQAAKLEAEDLAKRQATGKQRLFRDVADAISDGTIDLPSIAPILEKNNLPLGEFVELYAKTISESGRRLQQLSALRKTLNKAAESDPNIAAAIKQLDEAADDFGPVPLWTKFLDGGKTTLPGTEARLWPGYRNISNFSRGLIVTQFATAFRNMWSQTGRYSLEVLDQAIQGQLGPKGGTGNAYELGANFLQALKPKGREALYKQVDEVLTEFPLEQAALMALPAGEATLSTRIAQKLNFLNIAQESFFRRTIFDATLRGELRQSGANVEELLRNPSSIPRELVQEATHRALEATFVAAPKKGTVGNAIVQAYKAFPPLETINPFPRFWANSMQFLADFNPAGYAKAFLSKDLNASALAKATPEMREKILTERAKILSKATLGTALLAGGLAIRNMEGTRGEKWYHIKAGDQNIDTRAFAPFSTYLFLADVMTVMGEAGGDVVDGKTLKQALNARFKYTTNDLVQATLGLNRIAGTGLVAVDLIKGGSLERKMDLVKDMAGQYIGRFTVPFRTLKDVVGGGAQLAGELTGNESLEQIGLDEQKMRDTKQPRLIGPTIANIPVASQTLPEQFSPIQAEYEPGRLAGIPGALVRQFSGISPKKATVIGEAIDRLGIEFYTLRSRTGEQDVDNEIHKFMGPLVEMTVEPIVQDPRFQKLQPPVQKFLMQTLFKQMRGEATKLVKQKNPEMAKRLKLKDIPGDQRDLIQSISGIDIRDAGKPK